MKHLVAVCYKRLEEVYRTIYYHTNCGSGSKVPYLIYQYAFYEVDWVKYCSVVSDNPIYINDANKGFNPGLLLVFSIAWMRFMSHGHVGKSKNSCAFVHYVNHTLVK